MHDGGSKSSEVQVWKDVLIVVSGLELDVYIYVEF